MSTPTTNAHTQMNGNGTSSWTIHASRNSKRTVNPIRAIVDTLVIPKNATKSLIPLSIGDPTVFGNLEIPQSMEEALIKVIQGRRANGYPPSIGTLDARTAVATRYTTEEAPITPVDVILASGCSGALAIAIAGLCDEGDNILLPKPGFSLYKTLAGHDNVEARYYNLLPEKSWEIDLKHLESFIDEKTRAIVVNNPGNPTGSNFTREHLLDILALAEQHHLPIISDEIYGDMVFHPHTFFSMARLTTEVPIISVGGIAKQYLVPGWRVGWLIVHDRHDRLKEVREGLNSLSQLILGPNSLIQAALPEILHHTLPSFYSNLIQTLQSQAEYLTTRLNQIAGLRAVAPQGAMYLMAEVLISQFTDIKDDRDYVQKLLDEEMVFLLPASCFMAPNFVRFVFCAPIPILSTACDRIAAFNTRHIKPEYANTSYSTIQALKQVALVTMVDAIASNGVTTQANGSPLVVPTPVHPAAASSS